jgi:hypothetical protein
MLEDAVQARLEVASKSWDSLVHEFRCFVLGPQNLDDTISVVYFLTGRL